MRQFCESLPSDRLLQGNDADLDSALVKEKNFRTFVDPVSGAKLNYISSLAVLGHFASCLVSIFRLMHSTLLIHDSLPAHHPQPLF